MQTQPFAIFPEMFDFNALICSKFVPTIVILTTFVGLFHHQNSKDIVMMEEKIVSKHSTNLNIQIYHLVKLSCLLFTEAILFLE